MSKHRNSVSSDGLHCSVLFCGIACTCQSDQVHGFSIVLKCAKDCDEDAMPEQYWHKNVQGALKDGRDTEAPKSDCVHLQVSPERIKGSKEYSLLLTV